MKKLLFLFLCFSLMFTVPRAEVKAEFDVGQAAGLIGAFAQMAKDGDGSKKDQAIDIFTNAANNSFKDGKFNANGAIQGAMNGMQGNGMQPNNNMHMLMQELDYLRQQKIFLQEENMRLQNLLNGGGNYEPPPQPMLDPSYDPGPQPMVDPNYPQPVESRMMNRQGGYNNPQPNYYHNNNRNYYRGGR